MSHIRQSRPDYGRVFQVNVFKFVYAVLYSLDSGPAMNSHSTEMCTGSEEGSYLRLIDYCITQLNAQGPSRTCNESKEEGATLADYAKVDMLGVGHRSVNFREGISPGSPNRCAQIDGDRAGVTFLVFEAHRRLHHSA